MSCPTCDHTMANLVITEGMRYLHCERCGTVVVEDLSKAEADWDVGTRSAYVPKLVSRCREFMNVAVSVSTPQTVAALHRLGVVESIYPPGRKA